MNVNVKHLYYYTNILFTVEKMITFPFFVWLFVFLKLLFSFFLPLSNPPYPLFGTLLAFS